MRHLLATSVLIAILGVALPAISELGAQEQSEKKARNKSPKRTPPPNAGGKMGGYPPCTGIMWVDSLCRLPDGRVCVVGEYDLLNCKR